MLQREFKNNLKNEEGSGLILALMVLLVLSVLGASLGVLTVGSFKLGDVNRDSNSAYYVAEAGANLAYEELKENVEKAYEDSSSKSSFFGFIEEIDKSYGKEFFDLQFGDQPVAKVTTELLLTREKEREYIIKSTGDIAGRKRTVEKNVVVKWKDKFIRGDGLPIMPSGASLIVKKKIQLFQSGKIDGDIYIESDEKESFYLSKGDGKVFGKVFTNYTGASKNIFDIPPSYSEEIKNNFYKNTTNPMTDKIDWESIEESFLDELENMTSTNNDINLAVDGNTRISLKGNYKKDELVINGNHTIDVGENDVVIFTNKLIKNWGATKLEGTGSLTIVVSNSAKFSGKLNVGDKKGNLRIVFLNRSKNVIISGDAELYSQIIAPFSEVEIIGSGKNNGTIIAENVNIRGAGEANYHPFVFNDSENKQTDVNIEDLVEPGPTLESNR